MVERSRKSRPIAGLCARQSGADQLRRRLANSSPRSGEGNFPLRRALKTRKTRKESRYGRASFAPLVAPSRACREMAPQRLEKIESAPGNGMVSEASNPQHLVRGRVAGRALRRNNLGAAAPTAQRPTAHQFAAQEGRWEIFRLATPWNRSKPGRNLRGAYGPAATVDELALQKKAPNVLKSHDAELKSAVAVRRFATRFGRRQIPIR